MRKTAYILLILILSTIFESCGAPEEKKEAIYPNNESITGYNLAVPDKISVLPDILLEVSGLTTLDSATVVCVQDEDGIIFIYNEKKNEIINRYSFYGNGDYEGITRVDSCMYVLRSDGVLFEIVNYSSANFQLNTYNTAIPPKDNEGLCYDPENNRLLIAGKSNAGKDPELKNKRVIYGFDLQAKKLTDTPVFNFDVKAINEFAVKKNIQPYIKNGHTASAPIIRFRASAIAIHPLTKKLFLLSAQDHLLLIFDMNGNLEHIEPLNPEMYSQAEGITFYENGDMLISNEGKGSKPTILYFSYKK